VYPFGRRGADIMDAQIVGRKISELRKARNFTQQQLADELAVTNKAVSKWETGGGLPDIAMLPTLASVLGVSVDEIISDTLCGENEIISTENLYSKTRSYRRYVKKPVVLVSIAAIIIFSIAAGIILDFSAPDHSTIGGEYLAAADEGARTLYESQLAGEGFAGTDEDARTLYESQLAESIRTALHASPRIENALVIVYYGETAPSGFALSTRDSRVTITLTLTNDESLLGQDIQGIAGIVRDSIPDIKDENISITDTNLNEYLIGT